MQSKLWFVQNRMHAYKSDIKYYSFKSEGNVWTRKIIYYEKDSWKQLSLLESLFRFTNRYLHCRDLVILSNSHLQLTWIWLSLYFVHCCYCWWPTCIFHRCTSSTTCSPGSPSSSSTTCSSCGTPCPRRRRTSCTSSTSSGTRRGWWDISWPDSCSKIEEGS